jgi:hypothetical protein
MWASTHYRVSAEWTELSRVRLCARSLQRRPRRPPRRCCRDALFTAIDHAARSYCTGYTLGDGGSRWTGSQLFPSFSMSVPTNSGRPATPCSFRTANPSRSASGCHRLGSTPAGTSLAADPPPTGVPTNTPIIPAKARPQATVALHPSFSVFQAVPWPEICPGLYNNSATVVMPPVLDAGIHDVRRTV